jgi:DNA-binding transcriptional MerR regulator
MTSKHRAAASGPRFLTINEVSEQFRVPLSTLRYWRACNTGPESVLLGRRLLYPADALEQWITEQRSRTGRGSVATES